MSTRCRIMTFAAVSLAIAFVAARIQAANETPQSTPLWSGLVPDDAFNAVVVYPRRVLTSEAVAKLDIKSLTEDSERHGGFSLTDVEEAVVLNGPNASQPNAHRGGLTVALIGRFSKPYDSNALLKKWLDKPERYLVAGHRCYRREQTANSPPRDEEGICFLDDRTFVVASQAWLPSVLGAGDVKSPLVTALNKIDTSADLTEIFINSDSAREAMSEMMPMRELPPPLKPIADLSDSASAMKLTIHTTPEISLRITFVANDEAAAGKIADAVKSLQQTAQQMLPMVAAAWGPNMPAEVRKTREYATSLAGKVVDGLVPHQSGRQVTVAIEKLGTVEAFVSNLILPPVRQARVESARFQDLNNLRQIAIAMQIALSADGHFPAHAIFSKDGKPLLSWRVQLLPSLGQEELYKEFHLDEPWDSAHNKPLIAKMPDVFKCRTGKPLVEGMTRYVVPVGKDTMFDGDKGIAASDVPDGLSNTILALEVGDDKAVIWTKPDDLHFDPQKPLAGVGTDDQGIHVAFADGSAITFRKEIAPEKFRDLILRNDGHNVEHVSEITRP